MTSNVAVSADITNIMIFQQSLDTECDNASVEGHIIIVVRLRTFFTGISPVMLPHPHDVCGYQTRMLVDPAVPGLEAVGRHGTSSTELVTTLRWKDWATLLDATVLEHSWEMKYVMKSYNVWVKTSWM